MEAADKAAARRANLPQAFLAGKAFPGLTSKAGFSRRAGRGGSGGNASGGCRRGRGAGGWRGR